LIIVVHLHLCIAFSSVAFWATFIFLSQKKHEKTIEIPLFPAKVAVPAVRGALGRCIGGAGEVDH